MRRDSRLSGVLHVLLHMGQAPGARMSEAMDTNPVVIRRIMAGLRERGFVRSAKGHGRGWTVACDFAATTLRDIYDTLGRPAILGMGNRIEAPGCLVEQAVNTAFGDSFDAAEALLLDRFGRVTLTDLAADFKARTAARGGAVTPISIRGTDHAA